MTLSNDLLAAIKKKKVKPRKTLITIRIPKEVKDKLNALASILGAKPSKLASELFSIKIIEAINSMPNKQSEEQKNTK